MEDQAHDGTTWFDAETTTFGDRVTGAREAAGLSQPELAKRLGVRVKTIRAWEQDQSEPRANKLGTLAGILGVSMMWLLAGQGEGLDSPELSDPLDGDIEKILIDLRQMRQEQVSLAERMGLIEKRLRAALGNS
ncbi:helix-turn-helix domain-containing protein [Jannaschia sp. CCS1]|uniref:helix-turn-helix domain-containing protein n=1 Tax=Jannaschia sp. (strain CCS1) TaxID=290400 RepID=UPI000053D206|nr:helix-turn-helix domain-containing protein [Jannaschia sp. CCS1]ABD55570.1 transcriptional regulator, XRE family [Jannaschia sp. CCS1]